MKNWKRIVILLGFLSAISLAAYLLAAWWTFHLGFPLDDAWIHQTYARNLALHGEWAFIPGQPSAGSTAPLWSGLLALGYLIRSGPFVWTFLLGWLLLWVIGLTGVRAFRSLSRAGEYWAISAGILLIFEWHLVWSAGSGMETLLYSLLILVVFTWMFVGKVNWLGIGMLTGVSVWLRPDGITLAGPVVLFLFLSLSTPKSKTDACIQYLGGMALLIFPYLFFNYLLAGNILPNTFFAKQAEYAILRQASLGLRIYKIGTLPLIGAGIILLPGFIYQIWYSFRSKNWGVIVAAIWFLGYLFLYAWRLPVIYQHGRYLMPVMPVYFLLGFAGLANWAQINPFKSWRRLLRRTWLLTAGMVCLLFWILGAQAYARDVAIIESEMVDAASWVAGNIPPGVRVAAHDIGALGFFGNHTLVDLAGLVSPQVIPFIRDENRLATFLDEQHVEILVTFPGWYPSLVKQAKEIYTTSGKYSPESGGENMTVYSWK